MSLTSPVSFSPDWTAATSVATPFRHTWAPIGNIDQFRWLAHARVLDHVRMARDELGLRHVRAVAMYAPPLYAWGHDLADWQTPAAERHKHANWQLIDLALEGLLDLGVKPVYTTCFMPPDFTDDPARCWPDGNAVGMPRDLAQWSAFVAEGVQHHLARYGRSELRSWYFECWNEPNLRGAFFSGSQAEFFQLWSATWRAIKSVDPELRIGGPSTARGEWLSAFLDFTAKDGTSPDYLITHVYNNDSASAPLSPFDGPPHDKREDSPHFASGVIRGVRRELDQRGWSGEVHWNEWGRSWFPHDPLKETPLEAAFVVKTMADAAHEADAFAFWCLSDIYNQCGFQTAEFQGHYGLLSLHGLRKPAWFAHQLLNRLGHTRVPCTGGTPLVNAIATRDNGRGAVLVYAYPEHETAPACEVTVRVALPAQAGPPTLTRIGAQENNIVAAWRALGAPAYPTPAQLAALRAQNALQAAPATALHREGDHVSFTMECPGVALLEGALI
ncbi:MAG: hypothetical protein NTV22_04505 [bacterium]|nr:hypothetical protein [bacterium]